MSILRDPTVIAITPSPTPGVTNDVLTFAASDGYVGQVPLPYNVGNPPPDSDGLLRIAMSDARQGSTATGPFVMTAIAMAGELQSAASEPTTAFDFTAPVPPEPPDAPQSVTLSGGHYPRP